MVCLQSCKEPTKVRGSLDCEYTYKGKDIRQKRVKPKPEKMTCSQKLASGKKDIQRQEGWDGLNLSKDL